MSIALRLKGLRERAGVGQAEVAAAADVTVTAVSEWESGKKKPSRAKIRPLAKFFNVSSDYILDGVPTGERAETDIEARVLRALRTKSEAAQEAYLMILSDAPPSSKA